MNGKIKLAVIGGGAAGLLACCRAVDCGIGVTLFERSRLLGMKLGITGKGRCNLTNDCTPDEFIKNVTKNAKFLYSAINAFSPEDTMKYFENLGVPLKTERGGRVFPVSDKATDIVLALKNHALKNGCRVIGERVRSLSPDGKRITEVKTENHVYDGFDDFLLCTGGLSYPVTGSSGDGFEMARALGHTVTPLMPSLVGIECAGTACPEMQGLTLKNISVKLIDKTTGKMIYGDFGELLFTHFGMSGPVILSASAHMRNMSAGRYVIVVDEKPALSPEQLDRRLLSDFEKYRNKQLSNALCDLLPSKMIAPFISMCRISPETEVNAITHAQRLTIVSTMKGMSFDVSGFRPTDEAVVTSGGISVSEISPKTMCSKLYENLYFAGEIIDVDAYTGGFNLQTAFSTAAAAVAAIAGK